MLRIVPEPSKMILGKEKYAFDGFDNFPSFLKREYDMPSGNWKIKRISKNGNGLKIKKGEVWIWGDERLAYASLIQMVKQLKDHLLEIEIEESPLFKFRGYHLDIARGGIPKVETFKSLMRWLFLLKYNYFGIYLEDLFPWDVDANIGRTRGRLTKEELREILSYSENLGIEVFPSLELTGHMENVLQLPKYREFNEWHNPKEGCLDLSNEEARNLAIKMLKEVLDFFPSKYIHIGGDETWALGRGKSLNKTWNFQGDKLYESHYATMIKEVKAYSKIPIMWADMLTGMYLTAEERRRWEETLASDTWNDAVMANWDYSAKSVEDFAREVKLIGSARKTRELYCPGLSDWNTYYPDFNTALPNMRNFSIASIQEDINGFLLTSWGDDGQECLFSFLDPLILAMTEYAGGNEKEDAWKEKWQALTSESDEVVNVRESFGKANFRVLKRVLFSELNPFETLEDEELIKLKRMWEDALNASESVSLPEDLNFMREMLNTTLMKISGANISSKFVELSDAYSKLWINERKIQGLERIISRFWAMAGISRISDVEKT
jgi:hexosaminidase